MRNIKLTFGIITLISAVLLSPLAAQDFNVLEGLNDFSVGSSDPGLKFDADFVIDSQDKTQGQIRIIATLNESWCVYSTTQPVGGPKATKLTIVPQPAIVEVGQFSATTKPKIVPPGIFPVKQEKHYQRVEWRAPITLVENLDPSSIKLEIMFNGQTCKDGGSCIPVDEKLEASFTGFLKKETKTETAPAEQPSTNLAEKSSYKIQGKQGEFFTLGGHSVITGSVSSAQAAPGSTVKVKLTVSPTDDYHVYAFRKDDKDRDDLFLGYKPTVVSLSEESPWKMTLPSTSSEVIEKPLADGFELLKYHEGATTWEFEVLVPESLETGVYPLVGMLGYQTCTDSTCDAPKAVKFEVFILATDEPVSQPTELAFSEVAYADVAERAAASIYYASSHSQQATSNQVQPGEIASNQTSVEKKAPANLGWIILFSFIGGMILNLMPCVLPVVGLKIMSFVEQSGEDRVRVFMLNFVYSLGVISVFMVIACFLAFAGSAWGQQGGNKWFIISMTSVVFVFALSLLEVWEIQVPSFIGSGRASQMAQQDGYVGAFFKGTLATILSTPCSGPLLGPVFAQTLSVPPYVTFMMLFSIGLGMASPYLLIGMFPKLISFLPKPGNWMVTFKQLMGFVMMLTAVYLLYTLQDDLVIATLVFLVGLALACWMIGKIHLTKNITEYISLGASALLIAGITGAISYNFFITNVEHQGWVTFEQSELATVQEKIKNLQKQGSTVMVDFTADWCPTCQYNFYTAINTDEVNQFSEENNIQRRIIDWSDTSSPESQHIKEFVNKLGYNSIPILAIFPANKPNDVIVLADTLTKETILNTLKTTIPATDVSESSISEVPYTASR